MPRRQTRSSRDLVPTCSVRFYVGAGIPGETSGRYRGLPTSFDKQAFQDKLTRIFARNFPNFTKFKARGVWKGGSEDSLVIEVFETPARGSCARIFQRAERIGQTIAKALGQEAVLIIASDVAGRTLQGLAFAA